MIRSSAFFWNSRGPKPPINHQLNILGVSPIWLAGANYIIQLAGIGGLVPNTVLVDWPEDLQVFPHQGGVMKTYIKKDDYNQTWWITSYDFGSPVYIYIYVYILDRLWIDIGY